MNNPEIIKLKDPELIYNKLISNNYYIITKAYLDCDIYLSKVNFDSKESGSTCNLIINIGTHIICANTGDSRSLLIYGENSFIPLSVDFKPEMPEEMNRIILSGGEVRQINNAEMTPKKSMGRYSSKRENIVRSILNPSL